MRKFVIFALILFFDFVSKYWVAHQLPLIQLYSGFPFGGIGILNTSLLKISFVHTTNTGTAWGFFSNYQIALLVVRMLVTGGILSYLLYFSVPKYLQIPLTCIAAGALGNIIDFFLYGHVIDMAYFIFYKYSYPIFNIADAAIFLSVLYLFFFSKKTQSHRRAPSS
ncbi:MAG: Lipoprotein signal peptidase [Chlamydiae bacterium]|nr:Lipoprotein signal peptidase [Chlamydiota bacterium]